LVATLLEYDLVDELRLMVDPLLLGTGTPVFRDNGVHRNLRLVDNRVTITTTGAILATYALA
jgi:riboflavin biosynthesis pyrimidine reductase